MAEQTAMVEAAATLGEPIFQVFRLSRGHHAAELQVMRRWWVTLERYGLAR
jgi:hypothetical protein